MRPSLLAEVHRRLVKSYVERHGPLGKWVAFDPVTQMVHVILDGRTRESISKRAFWKLRRQFASWDELRRASPDTVVPLIQSVTHAERKAVYICAALHKIHVLQGTVSLDFLAEKSVDDARSWLEGLLGVGPKVSAAVVNFSTLRKPALVVDSHYQRIIKCLGWVPAKANAKAVDRSLSRLVPSWMTVEDMQQNYFVMKQHGQTICRDPDPNCRACILSDLCATGRRRLHAS